MNVIVILVKNIMKNRIISASFAACMFALSNGAWAQSFTVQDIRINGLQSVNQSTVLSSIPVRAGGVYQEHMTGNILRTLFKSGLFDNVSVERQGNTLVVNVQERSAIGQININGNRKVSDEQIKIAARRSGILVGRTMNPKSLARLKYEVQRQYQAIGAQALDVKTQMRKMGNGRQAIDINITEGNKSRVKSVRITGNRAFSEAQLLKLLDTGPRASWAFMSTRNEYSKEKMSGDLDKLTAFYRDRGYLNFKIISPKVSLDNNKRDININIQVSEGDQFRVGKLNVTGTGLSPQLARQAVKLREGQVFSQKQLEESRVNLRKLMGKGGFANTKIKVKPRLDNARKLVHMDFQAIRGPRVYVRRIEFRGNYRTKDEVFRRELRQFESSWLSGDKIEQSKRRIQRLPFVEAVAMRAVPVAGAPDQVDVEVTIKERLSNQFTAGVGYSQSQGVLFNIGLKQQNFLGSGKTLGVNANHGGTTKKYSLNYNNPYHTVDGIGRGFNIYYNKTDYDEEDLTSSYVSNSYGGDINYTFPMTESDSLRISLGAQKREIITSDETPQYIDDFIAKHGNEYNQFIGKLSYVHDTRDRSVFPTEGNRHRMLFEVGLPGSDLAYYKVKYKGAQYWSLSPDLTLALKGNVYYGKGADGLDELPFFERYYAGGIGSVRGYEKNSLGGRDENNDARGGDFAVNGTAELSFPVPFAKDVKGLRMSAFIDGGNVYDDVDDFDADEIRYSAGIGATWLSPLGPLTVSYAKPLNAEDGDEEQAIQFTIGANF